MAVTIKEIAQKLGLSPGAVSLALNDRPGVSDTTRRLVVRTAEEMGYDFSRLVHLGEEKMTLYFICCQTSAAFFSYAPVFDEILRGAAQECEASGFRLKIIQFALQQNELARQLEELRVSRCAGFVLLGTELPPEVAKEFSQLPIPMVIVDSYVKGMPCSCVLVNNYQGAYRAADYLISSRHIQPGYLRSSVPLRNFNERWEGFQGALRANGMHASQSAVHTLTPTVQGATTDMLALLDRGTQPANCYFAENDLIAIGAVKALRQKGYRVPQDIAVIGFDNIPEGQVVEPALSTVAIPRVYMGRVAVRQLVAAIRDVVSYPLKIEVSTELTLRAST